MTPFINEQIIIIFTTKCTKSVESVDLPSCLLFECLVGTGGVRGKWYIYTGEVRGCDSSTCDYCDGSLPQ